jgi:PKD repeat protein
VPVPKDWAPDQLGRTGGLLFSSRRPAFSIDMSWGCDSVGVVFMNSSEHATAFEWQFGDGSAPSQNPAPYHVYGPGGPYTITLRAVSPNGCVAYDTLRQAVEVLRTPQVSFTNTSQYASSYVWELGDGRQTQQTDVKHTYRDTGDYTVQLIGSNPQALQLNLWINRHPAFAL